MQFPALSCNREQVLFKTQIGVMGETFRIGADRLKESFDFLLSLMLLL